MSSRPNTYELRIELGGAVPKWPEPEPVSAERMHNILSVLAAKIDPSSTP